MAAASSERAVVWRRRDFSESSRLVTLVCRDLGKVNALAKGAHRAKSPFLGRLDLFNLVRPELTNPREGSLRVLRGAELLHEPRGLRAPTRFLVAAHIATVFDAALPEGRPDPELFELLTGGLRLLERCPEASLVTVLAGLELRFLACLGALGDLTCCATCGNEAAALFATDRDGGLRCGRHTDSGPGARRALRTSDLEPLRALHHAPGKSWPAQPAPTGDAIAVLGGWVRLAIDRATPQRRAAYVASLRATNGERARIRPSERLS